MSNFGEGHSSYKCVIYWKNQTRFIMWSRDYSSYKKEKNPHLGLVRFQRYIFKKLESIQTALVYDKQNNGDKLILKYVNGVRIL